MKRILLAAALAALAAAPAQALVTTNITDGWLKQPVATKGVADKSEVIAPKEEPDAWKEGGRLAGKPDRAKGEPGGNNEQAAYACWFKRTLDVPAAWRGRSVRYEQQLNWCDAVVFVNGKKAGVALHPDGAVELAPFLNFGKPNEIRIFVTNRGYGTGEPGIVYAGRDDYCKNRDLFYSPAMLNVRSPAFVENVWAIPSWRKKRVTWRCEVPSLVDQEVELVARVWEDEGRDPETKALCSERDGARPVKTWRKTFALKAGTNTVEMACGWADAVPWECDDPHLYNATVEPVLKGGKAGDAPGRFVFGFREQWLDGRTVMANGHPQRWRGFWRQQMPKDLADVKRSGFNLVYATHQHESRFEEDPATMESYARAGLQLFDGSPTIATRKGRILSDPFVRAQYERCVEHWARSHRNLPVVAGSSVGVNMMCAAWWMMGACDMGRHRDVDKTDIPKCMNVARPFVNPGTLFFAHGDGNLGDVGNCNFYFNYVPLQEREEWYSHWSRFGEIPCYPAEFGAPYYAVWFGYVHKTPQMTEWLAKVYGERAYVEEEDGLLARYLEFARDCAKHTHGGWVKPGRKSLYDFSPLGREFNGLLIDRVSRCWRAFGQGPSPMYLDSWKWNDDPANWMLRNHELSNRDLVCFLGGAPQFTDKTRAYAKGEPIAKQLVFVWDGSRPTEVEAAWRLVDRATGKAVAEGSRCVALEPFEIRFEPVELAPPPATAGARADYRLEVAFAGDRVAPDDRTDSFDLSVYSEPLRGTRAPDPIGKVALFDPRGESGPVLAACGVAARPVDSIAALVEAGETEKLPLVIGHRALDGLDDFDGLDRLAAHVQAGGRLLVLAQGPAVWKALGFQFEDSMPRALFNVGLPGVDDADLSWWRGMPLPLRDGKGWTYGEDWGHIQKDGPQSGRGWRWKHTHAVASEMLLVPQRAGFRPLVRGDFDHSYSPLLRLTSGKGAATFCTLDFEGRVGHEDETTNACPAAAAVARATFREFLADRSTAEAPVFVYGEEAERLAGSLGLDAAPWEPGDRLRGGVLLAGGTNVVVRLRDVQRAVGKDGRALLLRCDAAAAEAGLAPAVGATMERVAWDDKGKAATNEVPFATWRAGDPAFVRALPGMADVGPSLLRLRDAAPISALHPAKGWKVDPKGAIAMSEDGRIVFDQIPLYLLADRAREAKDWVAHRNWSQTLDNQLRRHALLLGAWGARPDETTLARALHIAVRLVYEPIEGDVHVLSPWPVAKEDGELMLDTLFDEDAEEQARTGRIDLERKFRPEGLEYAPAVADRDWISWATTMNFSTNGLLDFKELPLAAKTKYATHYLVAHVERKADGPAYIKTGFDWRAILWVNGEEVLRSYKGGNKPDSHLVPVQLRKGDNVISMKFGNGSRGRFVWMSLSNEDKAITPAVEAFAAKASRGDLYWSENRSFDPFLFIYW